jgi:hypothetical protein
MYDIQQSLFLFLCNLNLKKKKNLNRKIIHLNNYMILMLKNEKNV